MRPSSIVGASGGVKSMSWYKSKTNKTAIATILGSIAGYLSGAMDPATAIQTGVMGIMAIFMRQGIEKSGK